MIVIFGNKSDIEKGDRIDQRPRHRDLIALGVKWDGEKYVFGEIVIWPEYLYVQISEWNRMLLVVEQQALERDRIKAWADRIARYPYAAQGSRAAGVVAKYMTKAEKLSEQIKSEIEGLYGEA